MPISKNKKWLKGRSKHLSGFCNNYNQPPQCEGTKPRDDLGRPKMTCPIYESCPCDCHERLDMMFETTGLERVEMPNPDYKPPVPTYVIPEMRFDDPLAVAVGGDGASASTDVQQITQPAHMPPAAPLAQRRTPTGRAARGGLEAQVWDACSTIAKDFEGLDITPKLVSDWIVNRYKIPTPSSGAINAVWDRWTKLGYAEQAKKPNRFLKFAGEGTWEELLRLKASSKRAAKASVSAARRGFR